MEIEKAFELDRVGSLGFFAQPLNIGGLKHLDLMYLLAAEAKQEHEGTDAAIAYLAGKLKVVDYLSRPPLLQSLVLRPRDYVTKLVSGLLAGKLPLDGNPVAIHVTIPGPSLLAQASDVSDPAFA